MNEGERSPKMKAEREVTFDSNGARLSGTLVLPEGPGPFPAVLLVVGSGRTDRDENAGKLRIDSFRQIAESLAEQGLASLRFDKRGVGASEGDFWSAGMHDNVADAAAGVACLRTQADVDPRRVFVLGHSEGAMIAIRLAATDDELAGAVVLSGFARSGEDCLVWQALKVSEGMKGFTKWLIDLLHIDVLKAQRKALRKIKQSRKDTMRVQLVQRINAKWLREFLTYDPAEDLAHIRVPVLAITGSKDIQTPPEDLSTMERLVADIETHEVPDLTHILRKDAGEPSLATYREQVKRPVDASVLELVSGWLRRQATVDEAESELAADGGRR
jgi:pimeloyl-ACP methyl ester carboxylesterase